MNPDMAILNAPGISHFSRYDCLINTPTTHQSQAIFNLKGNTRRHYNCLSVNDVSFFVNDKKYDLNKISELLDSDTRYIVLTNKEYDLTSSSLQVFPKNIEVFEKMFPFFEDIKYQEDHGDTIRTLKRGVTQITRWGYDVQSFHHQEYRQNHKAFLRKISTKSSLDNFFYHLPHRGYQEVFKNLEKRKDRKIVCLDFNSMYLSCMEGKFPHPNYLSYEHHDRQLSFPVNLKEGLYRVKLSQPKSNFIKRYHYFGNTLQGEYLNYKLGNEVEIEAYLLVEEINFFKNHFDKIYLS